MSCRNTYQLDFGASLECTLKIKSHALEFMMRRHATMRCLTAYLTQSAAAAIRTSKSSNRRNINSYVRFR